MSESKLRQDLIRLAKENPELQDHLLPILATKKVAAADYFFELVDKRKWHQVRQALKQAGDDQSAGLWSEASLKLMRSFQLDMNEEMAFNMMRNLLGRPSSPEGLRNQVFKIADLMEIRLPSGMFASENESGD